LIITNEEVEQDEEHGDSQRDAGHTNHQMQTSPPNHHFFLEQNDLHRITRRRRNPCA
jgi:hypothetical protein